MSSSFWNNPIVHGIISVVLFIIPFALLQGGSWESWTLGGLLVAVQKFLTNKNQGLTGMGARR